MALGKPRHEGTRYKAAGTSYKTEGLHTLILSKLSPWITMWIWRASIAFRARRIDAMPVMFWPGPVLKTLYVAHGWLLAAGPWGLIRLRRRF